MESRSRHLIDASDVPVALTCVRCDGRTVEPLYANNLFFQMVGCERDLAAGDSYPHTILDTQGWRDFAAGLLEGVQAGCATFDVGTRQSTGDGAVIWTRTRCRFDAAQQVATCAVIDATASVDTANRLRMTEDAFRIAARMSGKSIATYDVSTRTLTIENAAEGLVNAPLRQQNVPEDAIAADALAPESVEAYRAFYRDIHQGVARDSVEVRMRDFATGEFRWLHAEQSAVFDAEGRPASAVIVFSDVTAQREREQAQQTLAERDALTGVLNRATFERRCGELLERTPSGRMHAFVMIDLDRLKATNDRLGHAAGDVAIAAASAALAGAMREDDFVGRIGGDEFMACLLDVKSRDAAGAIARRLCKAVEDAESEAWESAAANGGMAADSGMGAGPLTASLGIALFPQDGAAYDELYRNADVAMYRAKRGGGNELAFFADKA